MRKKFWARFLIILYSFTQAMLFLMRSLAISVAVTLLLQCDCSAVRVKFPSSVFSNVNWRNDISKSSILFEDGLKGNHTYVAQSRAHAGDANHDIYAYENWFYGVENGIIVESGALDGMLFSTSHMFEKYANWTAIHIEADLLNYKNLCINRQNSVNVNCALCDSPQTLHYVTGHATAGILEFMSKDYVSVWHSDSKTNPEEFRKKLLPVECITFESLMSNLNVNRIDIWILDVEGAEEAVLKGVDFNKVSIKTIVMECDVFDQEKNTRKLDILKSNGFTCEKMFNDCYCTHKDFKPSSKYTN